MPLEETAKTVGATVGVISFVSGVFVWLFNQGKKQGAMGVTVAEHTEEIEELKGRFTTENNEPALMTFRAHKHICDRSSKLILAEFKHVVKTVEEQSEVIAGISKEMGCVAKGLAVLEERVKNNGPSRKNQVADGN